MSGPYDAIVIGAGPNGLTTAATLASKGRKVLVVERLELVGGLAGTFEFHPGYRSPGLLHDASGLRPGVIDGLQLERHGLELGDGPEGVLALGDGNGPGLWLEGDVDRTAGRIAAVSARDAESYRHYVAFIDSVRGVIGSFFDQPPIDLLDLRAANPWQLLARAWGLRRLGREKMMELLRLPPMCVADWLDEWFETDALKAALALPATSVSFTGPRSPGSNANLLLQTCLARRAPRGGAPAVVAALESAARARGVEIRLSCEVQRIRTERGAVRGVVLAGGESIDAAVVAASCDPRLALSELLEPGTLSSMLEQRIAQYRSRGIVAQVLFGLNSAFEFPGHEGQRIAVARTGGSMDDIEHAFDAVKYGRSSEHPVLEIHVPDACLDLAPTGCTVLSVLVHFAPYELRDGWDAARRERLAEQVTATLARYLPDLPGSVVASSVLAPPDIQRRYAVGGGHLQHGEHALDQLLIRPVPQCNGYATPVSGLWLCGSGSHPGGGLSCAPGSLAAAAILRG